MNIPPISPTQPKQDPVTFGYSNVLKTLYKKGKFPSVKYGFYGEPITKKNVTLEHLLPKSQGGKSTLDNFVLTSADKNQERGVRPLAEMLNWENVGRYLEQFRDVVVGNFIGNEYIQMILRTINKLIKT